MRAMPERISVIATHEVIGTAVVDSDEPCPECSCCKVAVGSALLRLGPTERVVTLRVCLDCGARLP